MSDWDDFRLVRAIAEQGGLTRAADHLGINHSTAFRRLGNIEASIQAPLFERHRSGYVPTEAGRAMVLAAGRMDDTVAQFNRELAGRSSEPAGDLRITAPAGLVTAILMPIFAGFRRRYPRIRLDLVLAEESLNLCRDADVAIRASDRPPPSLVGRRLATINWAIYGTRDFVGRPLSECPWICPSEGVAGGRFTAFAKTRMGPDGLAMSINTVLGLREAIEAGCGVGPLSRWDADIRPNLIRLSDNEPELATSLWILTHADLRHAPRVRAFMDAMATEIGTMRPMIEGTE
ncbi:LysR family transcriptional regulator [Methylobacterium marchantiae]|uniref:LysR family transcriptional regulator n=1 Tax=Methylobacterium marchantiae TaxID=600331 RepID=A0ABW3WWA6_9HYPH|nr:HTH-type transcriptional regulator ArgP [Methylobacterium marchantiae]